jgi:D-glycero-alpha-D-manno-heptose-7-phosphate kinase
MIISRTPLRISFVGGGTDLPEFYCSEPGAVVTSAINKYIYITVNKKFDDKIRASYSVTEIVDRVDELKHELIREALKMVELDGGIEITSISDIPSQGTGLGSSSTYAVGLLNALYAYKGHYASPERLAQEACEIEIQRCRKPIGKQDQYIAAYGNMQYMRFNPDESVYVDPIIFEADVKKKFFTRLLLLYTGITRSADGILREQGENSKGDPGVRQRLRVLTQLAGQLREALLTGRLDEVGEVMHQGWLEKKKLASAISNGTIDHWYDCARKHGAIGGKLLGAGGGGFLLFYAPPERHAEIMAALPELKHVPFRLESQGSKIIFVEENQKWR